MHARLADNFLDVEVLEGVEQFAFFGCLFQVLVGFLGLLLEDIMGHALARLQRFANDKVLVVFARKLELNNLRLFIVDVRIFVCVLGDLDERVL